MSHRPIRPSDDVLAKMRDSMTVRADGCVMWTKNPSKSIPAMSVAGWSDEHGYRCIRFGNRLIFAHHVAWYLSHGDWPDRSIDHIDGDKSNNRPDNLRLASHAENMRNMKKRDRALPHGVDFHTLTGKYRARIKVGHRTVYLGIYSSVEGAADARRAAELEYHGDFAAHIGAQAMEKSHPTAS